MPKTMSLRFSSKRRGTINEPVHWIFKYCLLRMFVFGTNIAYGMQIPTKVTGHFYDIGVKGQIYLKALLYLVTQTPLPFF